MNICFIGKSGVGKTTIAEILVNKNRYTRLSFAMPIKSIAEFIFKRPIDKKDPADRKVLQILGTEVGRAREDDIWISHLYEMIEESYEPIVIDDCRYINEAEFLKEELGYFIVKIVGRETTISEENAKHDSETEQDQIIPDATIDNSGTLEETMDQLYQIMEEYKRLTN